MLDFIAAVFFFNLIFGVLLFAFRRRIPITTPVLVLTALISFTCTVSFPYIAARLDHPGQALVFFGVILFSATLLGLLDSRYPVPVRDSSVSGYQYETGNRETEYGESREKNENPAETTPVAAVKMEQASQAAAGTIDVPETDTGETIPGIVEPDTTDVYHETETLTEEPELIEVYPETETLAGESQPEHQTETEEKVEVEVEKEAESEEGTVLFEAEPQTTQVEPGESFVAEPFEIPADSELEATGDETGPGAADRDHDEFEPGLRQIIDQGFASKEMGHYEKAIKTFNKALQLQPEPRLAILLLLEISDIYSSVGQYWQATEILKILLANWRSYLDEDMRERLQSKISELQRLLN